MATIVGGRDYRNIAASSLLQGFRSVRYIYTLQSGDLNNEGVSVVVPWTTPFADSLYTVSVTLQDLTNNPAVCYDPGCIYNVSPSGVTVGFFPDVVNLSAGDQVVIHLLAFHD